MSNGDINIKNLLDKETQIQLKESRFFPIF